MTEISCDDAEILNVVSAVLERLVENNNLRCDAVVTKFHAVKIPSISILDYLLRIQKYARCSSSCFVLALIYIDRLIEENDFILSNLSVHRVVITSVMIAAKFFDDEYFNNSFYAKVGGIRCLELNQLEVDFLFRVNFSLHVRPSDFFCSTASS